MDVGNSARLFALANLAAADAAIACWDSKRYFSFWRPVTAIREGEGDGNPGTIGVPDWEPLVNTPNYPDYTSGANAVTAAMTTIARKILWYRHLQLHGDEQRTPLRPGRSARSDVSPTPRKKW